MKGTIGFILIGTIIVVFVGIMVEGFIYSQTAPCSEFGNIAIKDVPYRCIKPGYVGTLHTTLPLQHTVDGKELQ